VSESPESGGSTSVQDHGFFNKKPYLILRVRPAIQTLALWAEAPQIPGNLVLTNWFTAMCTTSFTSFSERCKISNPISLDCNQLHVVVVAKPYAWLQEHSRSAFLRSVMIFSLNIVGFPPVQYCQISTTFLQ